METVHFKTQTKNALRIVALSLLLILFQTIHACPIQSPNFTTSVSGNSVSITLAGGGYNSYICGYGDATYGTTLTHSYTSAGTKTVCVRFIFTDSLHTANSCDTTICKTITIINTTPFTCPIQNPGFTASVNGNVVTLTKTGSNYTYYTWTYGDSTSGTSNTHTYTSSGVKTICLRYAYYDTTNTSHHCDTTICQTINITAQPFVCALQNVNYTTSITGNSVSIALSGTGYTSYLVGWGDATYTTSLTHTYTSTGTKTICVQFRDSTATGACDTAVCKTITINNSACTWPNLFTSIWDSCTASNRSLYGYSTLNTCYKYQWKVNGVIVGTTRTLTYPVTQNGAYAVCLTITDTCTHCDTTICSTRNITCIPTSTPCNWSSRNEYGAFWDSCTATNRSLHGYIGFNSPLLNCFKFQWTVNNVVVGSGRTLTYPVTQNGTYNVCVTVTDTCNHCDTTYCSTRTITCIPTTTTCNWSSHNPYVNFWDSCTATNKSLNGYIYFANGSTCFKYQWKVNGVAAGITRPFTYPITQNGTYNVCVTVTDTCNHCDTTFCSTRTITCFNNWTCPIQHPNFTTAVNGNTVTLAVSGTGFNGYLWNYGDGTTGTSNTHTYTSSGVKTICADFRYVDSTNTAHHCDTSICKTITIASTTFTCPIQGIYFSAFVNGNTVTLTKYGTGYSYYQWTYGDGTSGTSDTHTYTSSGVKTICLRYVYYDSTNTAHHCDSTYCKNIPVTVSAFNCQLQSVNFNTSVRNDTVYLTKTGGGYTSYIWSYGDGNYGTDNYHVYNSNGVKNICIKFTDSTSSGSCDTIICKTIGITGACDSSTCVLPGDADHDYTVNNFDIFAIGLSYNRTGLVRPNATTQYRLQPAPNWATNSYYVFNDKFVDCNGDGVINNADGSVILQNYIAKPSNHFNHRLSSDSLPPVFLAFDSLPVYQIGIPCNTTEIVSDINVGSPTHIAQNVYGIGFSVEYPPNFATDSCFKIQVDLDANSWFTNNEPVLYLVKNLPQFNRVDIGIARTTGVPRTGNGKIGKIKFVVEDGIFINGRISGNKQYTFAVNDVAGVDNYGYNISFTGLPTTAVFLVSGIKQNKVEGLKIYPNPANDKVLISANEIIESITIYDISGQVIKQEMINGFEKSIDISDLSEGMYMVEIHSNSSANMVKLIKSK